MRTGLLLRHLLKHLRQFKININCIRNQSKLQFSEMNETAGAEFLQKSRGRRKFYNIPEEYESAQKNTAPVTENNLLLEHIYSNVSSHDASFEGPYGRRQVVYCDYTASGQSLHFIEEFIKTAVLPFYGNTHTTTSVSSLQSTLFRHEAKDIIRNAVNASEHDAVLFVGNGCTSAVHKLIHALNLKNSNVVVFVGPFEHHSNLLPWREIGAQVIRITETFDGLIDLRCLEKELKKHHGKKCQLIGSFSAASNVTGILSDDRAVTTLLHKYGALAFWDYAAAGPYVDINMNPVITGQDEGQVYKDAVFLSPHKFVGGPGTPGILVAKKSLFRNPVPSETGGGTVFFVSRDRHRYLQEVEMREEGGTPSIIGAIRAGMVFQLKQSVGSELIEKREKEICKTAFSTWTNFPSLNILGNTEVNRLSIFSFLIYHSASGLYLHHNFVCAVLNDLFGIQSRGGCACSGPYSLDLLGIDEPLAQTFDELLAEDKTLDRIHLRRYREYSNREVIRPGFVRLNIPYFMSEEDVNFVIEAVALVAENGWKLLPQYLFNPETGEWRHRTHQVFEDRKWLGSVSYKNGYFSCNLNHESHINAPIINRKECLNSAREVFKNSIPTAHKIPLPDQELIFDSEASEVRWFLLPSEAKQYLLSERYVPVKNSPFTIRKSVVECTKNRSDFSVSMDNNNFIPSEVNVCRTAVQKEVNSYISKHIDGETNANTLSIDGFVNQRELFCDKKIKDNNDNEKPRTLAEKSECCKRLERSSPNILHLESASFAEPQQKCKWYSPPKKIFTAFLKAVKKFEMIQNGDRVLVCLSGGKDSLSLLHTLHQYKFYARKENVKFELGAMTVDPKSPAYDPSPLKGYLAALQVPYFYEEQEILRQAAELDKCKSICSFCSRLKRGRIYACARREGYNVIALGQHLDDLAESFLMSVFHNGRLRTMKASYTDKTKTLRIIRPFVFVRENELRRFAEQKKLPVIPENCPACFEAPKERHRVKQLLAAQEIQFPSLYLSLKSAMFPLMAINRTGIEDKIHGEAFYGNVLGDEDDTDEDI